VIIILYGEIKMSDMLPCPVCKGKKTVHCKSTVFGTGETTEMDLTCYECDGVGELTPVRVAAYEARQELWCTCEESTFGSYPQDGECNCGVHKHHVHCGTCGKISQIG
jgi:hypothetical protein